MLISASVLSKESTSSRFHSYVLQRRRSLRAPEETGAWSRSFAKNRKPTKVMTTWWNHWSCQDGIMIARGDMGIEVPFEMVPATKWSSLKWMLQVSCYQQLQTCFETGLKTTCNRSEFQTYLRCYRDGTDATMLSGEFANGKYPLESVTTMVNRQVNVKTSLNEYWRLNLIHLNQL